MFGQIVFSDIQLADLLKKLHVFLWCISYVNYLHELQPNLPQRFHKELDCDYTCQTQHLFDICKIFAGIVCPQHMLANFFFFLIKTCLQFYNRFSCQSLLLMNIIINSSLSCFQLNNIHYTKKKVKFGVGPHWTSTMD